MHTQNAMMLSSFGSLKRGCTDRYTALFAKIISGVHFRTCSRLHFCRESSPQLPISLLKERWHRTLNKNQAWKKGSHTLLAAAF
jgi:hypothetical protein